VRIGSDIGGTFTDVVLENTSGMFSAKVLTDNKEPEKGVFEGIRQVLLEAQTNWTDIDTFIHGTTLATNALIGRTGALTAFITTEGFRDVVEMRTESRFEQYDLNIILPAPLVERKDRHVIKERIDANGVVIVPFDEDEATQLAERLATGTPEGPYEAVAIGLLHAYRNDIHEQRLREVIARYLPNTPISISSDVAPQMREFERFNTVCANAYLQPLMAGYLRRLESGLQTSGASCPVYLIHSGGGLLSLDNAVRFPIRLVESGPAGGAIFSAHLAERYNLDTVLSYDMGGTTAKICLIENGTPKTANTFEVARTHRFAKGSGMPISIPVIEMIEIGAGGGSIASVDALGQIRVGPRSAGSEPGPACYQLGGTKPTVSDADLTLGRLASDTFRANTIQLSPEAANKALLDDIGSRLNLSAEAGAIGVTEVVDENMANAARAHAIENGKDVGAFTMVAFGGAAPLHAARLSEKLNIRQILIPPGAGVGSAIGFLRAPFTYEAIRSHYAELDNLDWNVVDRMLKTLETEATSFVLNAVRNSSEHLEIERTAFMRYSGQGWEIPVKLEDHSFETGASDDLIQRFQTTYTELFGRVIEGVRIEVLSWTVKVSTLRPAVRYVSQIKSGNEILVNQYRQIYDSAIGDFVKAVVVERDILNPRDLVRGPALIVESQTSVWVPSGYEAILQLDGCLLLSAIASGRSRL